MKLLFSLIETTFTYIGTLRHTNLNDNLVSCVFYQNMVDKE